MQRFIFMIIVLISPLWSAMIGAPDICPLVDMKEFRHYSKQDVSIKYNKIAAQGKNVITVALSNPKLPSGYIVSAFLDIINLPNGKDLEIIDGYPKTVVSLSTPGKYEFSMRVNLIYKGS